MAKKIQSNRMAVCRYCHKSFSPKGASKGYFCSTGCYHRSTRKISMIEDYGNSIAVIANNTGERFWFDADMLDKLKGYSWNDNRVGYLCRHGERCNTSREIIYAHRLVVSEIPENLVVDHIDRNTHNNRKSNLRVASRSQNYGNSKLFPRNTSGYKGVSFHKISGRWRATITYQKISYHLGEFYNPKEAARAYDRAARKLFGEYAATNDALGLLNMQNDEDLI